MKIKAFLFSLFALALAVNVSAQTATPNVKDRQVNHQKRIHQGVKDGELTKAEYKALQKEQRQINRNKKKAKADGKVTKREKAQLHRQQNQASRNVARKKNNQRDRNGS